MFGRFVLLPASICLVTVTLASAQVSAITDVTVINPRNGTVSDHRTVIVSGNRIVRIQSRADHLSKGSALIDGSGKYLIPGLWDAHVHLSKAGAISLPLFVANGVTGVRDMGSDLEQVKQWRAEIDRGARVGPEIKTSGQMLESQTNIARMKREKTIEPVDKLRIGLSNPDDGRAAVDHLASEGVDHIKMRTTPDLATFLAVSDEAKKKGLPFAAHPVAPAEKLMDGRLQSVEHLLEFPLVDRTPEAQKSLYTEMARSGLFLSDTSANLNAFTALSYDEVVRRINDRTGVLDSRNKYVCGYLLADWQEQTQDLKGPEGRAAYDKLKAQLPTIYRNDREISLDGVQFLAGTDTAVMLMYPGFSLHDELWNMVHNIGFTPMEVLRIATSNVASFYKQESRYGAIARGQEANLVLLDRNPREDMRNTTAIRGVMLKGKWFDRHALDLLLDQAAKSSRTDCPSLSGGSSLRSRNLRSAASVIRSGSRSWVST
jgi:imidazolonepropionase-like amidohydrolase